MTGLTTSLVTAGKTKSTNGLRAVAKRWGCCWVVPPKISPFTLTL